MTALEVIAVALGNNTAARATAAEVMDALRKAGYDLVRKDKHADTD